MPVAIGPIAPHSGQITAPRSTCFYLSKENLAGGPGPGHMRDDVLEAFIRDYIRSVTADEIVFSWQGGKPTLLGIPFFEKVLALQRKYAKPGQRILNDLQTNGTLLDEDWSMKTGHKLPGAALFAATSATAVAQTSKPNILFIMGDDIGIMQPGLIGTLSSVSRRFAALRVIPFISLIRNGKLRFAHFCNGALAVAFSPSCRYGAHTSHRYEGSAKCRAAGEGSA